MIKKTIVSTTLISLILLIAILFCSFAFVLTAKADCETISAYDLHAETSYKQNQEILQMFNNDIQTFSSNDENVAEGYSDIYAGSYLDSEGLLNVCLTIDIPMTLSSTEKQEIIYHVKEYSYTYLYSVYKSLTENISNLHIQGVGIDQKDNVVVIEIENESLEMDITNWIQEIGYDKESLRFSIVNGGNSAHIYNITAGEKIRKGFWAWGSTGTVGGPARRNSDGKIGIMTNDHVAPSGSTIYIGNKKINKPAINLRSGECDGAFIPFQDASGWNYHQGTVKDVKTDSNHSLVRYGGNSRIIQGAKTKKFGIKSGMTDGEITYTNFTLNTKYSDSDTRIPISCIKYSNSSLPGDSGGPVFVYYSGARGSYYLVALNFGGPGEDSSEVFGCGCRTDSLQRDMGITFLTLDNL
ncbi:MAG: S1 family peptidase [Clostridia bacterium]|nr:S1 family peptidase [Clostridia bacterium]